MSKVLIGNVRGPKGEKGDTGEAFNLPTVYLSDGNIDNVTADNEEVFKVKYVERGRTIECYALISWQGSSSLTYPKKNYKIKLFTDAGVSKKNEIKLRSTWTKTNRFNLKANWIDVTHARNVVSGNIVANVLKSNSCIPEQLYGTPNFGQVDGFPVLLYINGSVQGLYTFSLGKKDEMLGTTDKDNHILFEGTSWDSAVLFRTNIAKFDGSDWALEFPDDLTDAHKAKLNSLLAFVNSSDDATFAAGIESRVNVPMLIDYIILVQVFNAPDNLGKNMMLASYDGGESWVPQLRDLDTVMGLHWAGTSLLSNTDELVSNTGGNSYFSYNKLLMKTYTLYKDTIRDRYEKLRENELSNRVMCEMYRAFIDSVGEGNYNLDLELWPGIPSKNLTDFQQIARAIVERCAYLDANLCLEDD